MASGATCVQKLDDSRDPAIHTKYRISLRSSSMREPRYPLPRVVVYSICRYGVSPPLARDPGGRVRREACPLSVGPWHDSCRGSLFGGGKRYARPLHGARIVRPWRRGNSPRPARCEINEFAGRSIGAGTDNDPSAGSPTETLLRLLLPLNDKVQWTSRDVAGGEPPTSPRSEHFTGPFNR